MDKPPSDAMDVEEPEEEEIRDDEASMEVKTDARG
jgi:hypothetical protein